MDDTKTKKLPDLSTKKGQRGTKPKRRMAALPPCRCCGELVSFSASRIQWHSWICSQCANQARDASPERYLARKFAEYLRRRGVSGPYPGVDFVRQLLERSGLEDNSLHHQLCIVIKDPALLREQGAHLLDNAMLVPSRQRKTSIKTV